MPQLGSSILTKYRRLLIFSRASAPLSCLRLGWTARRRYGVAHDRTNQALLAWQCLMADPFTLPGSAAYGLRERLRIGGSAISGARALGLLRFIEDCVQHGAGVGISPIATRPCERWPSGSLRLTWRRPLQSSQCVCRPSPNRFVGDFCARHEGHERKFGFSHHTSLSCDPHSLVAEHGDDIEFAAEGLDHFALQRRRPEPGRDRPRP
jgi:hypothetical protein